MISLLFDIDGTLLDTKGAGVGPFERALRTVGGRKYVLDRNAHRGKTDYEIAGTFVGPELSQEVVELYSKELEDCLALGSVSPLPGVLNTLLKLRQNSNLLLHILSGNCHLGAEVKLKAAGLSDLFEKPYFCATPIHRSRVSIAKQADSYLDVLDRRVVVGDTAHDGAAAMECALDFVAVTSGNFTEREASRYSPLFYASHPWSAEIFLSGLGRNVWQGQSF